MREEAAQDELGDDDCEVQHHQRDHPTVAFVALQEPPQPLLPLGDGGTIGRGPMVVATVVVVPILMVLWVVTAVAQLCAWRCCGGVAACLLALLLVLRIVKCCCAAAAVVSC